MLRLSGPAEAEVDGEVIVEGRTICTTQGLQQGVAVWFASYYVLNCTYPDQFKKTLLFIQKVLLGINSSVKIPPLITSVQRKINIVLMEEGMQY